MQYPLTWLVILNLSLLAFLAPTIALAANGELEIRIIDELTQQPIAARLQIRDQRGRLRTIRRTETWQGSSAVDGRVIVQFAPGAYSFSVDRGPEYLEQSGHFVIQSTATDNKTIQMKRFANLSEQGWWSADLALSLPRANIDLWLRSTDLHMASVQTWSFDNSWHPLRGAEFSPPPKNADDSARNSGIERIIDLSAGRDDRWGGRALVFRVERPIVAEGGSDSDGSGSGNNVLPGEATNAPSAEFFKRARQLDSAQLCIAQPNAWDLPIWLASDSVDSFMLLGPDLHTETSKGGNKDPSGLPRDTTFFPDPHGWGRWSQAIYYHILNCGLRIPPVAGSGADFGSQTDTNPVGYARTYVHCGDTLDADSWWNELRRGRVMVTNGPLLIPRVNGELPGHVFTGYPGETVSLQTQLTLHTREKIEYLEIIQDGKVLDDVMLSELVDKQGVLPNVEFSESGWFLIRAVTTNPTYHVASTGPYYVQFAHEPRVSRTSAQFFLDWLDLRAAARDSTKVSVDVTRSLDQPYHDFARRYWQQMVARANAE